MTDYDLTPRWYLATTPADPDNPLLSRDCELLMPPAMVAGFQALGWRVVEIERERDDDDNG